MRRVRRFTLPSTACTAEEFVVSTLPRPSCPGHEFVVCTPLMSGCPNIEPVRHPAHHKVASAMCALAFRFPDPQSSLHRPVSQTTKRAPYMDPEAMKPVRPRGCPRDRPDPTARVARTLKPFLPPQLPRATNSTSCTGRPHHEAATDVPVARHACANLTARGSRTAELAPRPGFPSHRTALPHGAPEQQSHHTAQFPER